MSRLSVVCLSYRADQVFPLQGVCTLLSPPWRGGGVESCVLPGGGLFILPKSSGSWFIQPLWLVFLLHLAFLGQPCPRILPAAGSVTTGGVSGCVGL